MAGSLQLPHASHVRDRDKALLGGVLTGGGSGMDFFLVMPEENSCHAAFAVVLMEMVTFFWECTHLSFGSNS